jgi:hypothetical protein
MSAYDPWQTFLVALHMSAMEATGQVGEMLFRSARGRLLDACCFHSSPSADCGGRDMNANVDPTQFCKRWRIGNPTLFDGFSDPTRLEMHDMRFSAGQAALKFNNLGPVHFIDIRANIEIRSGAAELKRGHAALLSTIRIPAVGSRTSKGLCTCQLKPHHQRPAYGRALQTSSKQDGHATSPAGWALAFTLPRFRRRRSVFNSGLRHTV